MTMRNPWKPPATEHPYTSYNKVDDAPTLVGNWQEERALKDKTGEHRYKPWVERDESESIYATRQDNLGVLPTHERTLEHREQLASGEWYTQTQVTYQHPQQRVNSLAEYKGVPGMGPRERMELEMLMAEAKDLPKAPKEPPSFDTTYRTNFTEHDMSDLSFGARVMKDPDGRPAYHDPVFLAESKIMTKDAADRLIPPVAETTAKTSAYASTLKASGLVVEDTPITLYTEAQAVNTYGGEIYGTKQLAGPAAPHGKYTNFSKPMSDFTKVVDDE